MSMEQFSSYGSDFGIVFGSGPGQFVLATLQFQDGGGQHLLDDDEAQLQADAQHLARRHRRRTWKSNEGHGFRSIDNRPK